MLEARDLGVERGERLLFGALSLSAGPGTITQLSGRNGSGKTTLLRTLAGLVTPDSGTVRWRGVDIASSETFRSEMNYVGHQTGLNGELSGRENLHFLNVMLARDGEIDAALRQLEATSFADKPVRSLSAGQRQRLSLARLALFECTLWMLDEPFTALDRQARVLLETLISRHAAAGGVILIATHQSFESKLPVEVVALEPAA